MLLILLRHHLLLDVALNFVCCGTFHISVGRCSRDFSFAIYIIFCVCHLVVVCQSAQTQQYRETFYWNWEMTYYNLHEFYLG